MKILYVAPKYDYGRPERGLSFEHCNFFDTLFNMGNEITYFDSLGLLGRLGRVRMNALLRKVARSEKFDLMFVFLFENEFDQGVISEISKAGVVPTVNWFADDQWRFDNYSRFWAPRFNWVTTTDREAVNKYHAVGYKNVILSQWACNHFSYGNLHLDPQYDISFVGQAYGNRRETIDALAIRGLNIYARGQGWASGRATQQEMVEIVNRSRINLNLANASVMPTGRLGRIVDRYALYTPGLRRIWRKVRSISPRVSHRMLSIAQIKGRNFEIPGCAGFLLTDFVQGLDEYYQPDKDMVCYNTLEELEDKALFYLAHSDLRKQIARHGWKTTLERHTYVHRFNGVFREMGLKCDFSLEPKLGRRLEVVAG